MHYLRVWVVSSRRICEIIQIISEQVGPKESQECGLHANFIIQHYTNPPLPLSPLLNWKTQVWFQNRRSKERRMKKPNGCVRRNFFRSSSRRLQSGPTSNSATSNGSNSSIVTSQQSLIAGSRGGAKSARDLAAAIGQQQSSPGIDSSTASENQLKLTGSSQQQQANTGRQILGSPSDFGTSLTGGFTYFSGKLNLI